MCYICQMKETLTIRISPEVHKKIKQEALRQDRTVSALINKMLDIQVNYFPCQNSK